MTREDMMRITADQLRTADACESQVAVFEAEWQDGMPVEDSSVDRIVALDLDVDWAANHLLTAPAWAEYKRVRAQS